MRVAKQVEHVRLGPLIRSTYSCEGCHWLEQAADNLCWCPEVVEARTLPGVPVSLPFDDAAATDSAPSFCPYRPPGEGGDL